MYNENQGEELNRKSDAIYAMVKDFKLRGIPIDGVGLQMHISRLDLDTSVIVANIARLTALGLQVHLTELDVSLPVDSEGNASNEDLRRQAAIYSSVVHACLQNPACKIQDARRSKPGGSPTSIPGLALIPAHAARRCCLTVSTARNPHTIEHSSRSQAPRFAACGFHRNLPGKRIRSQMASCPNGGASIIEVRARTLHA